MAVAAAGRRCSVRVHVSRVRLAVQDGDQPAVLVGANTERQTDGATGVHQRSDRGGPGRQPDHDRAAGGGGVRGRRRQPVGGPPAPHRAGAVERAGVRDDPLRHVPGGHAAAVRAALQRRAAGLGRRAVLDQTGVELVRPGDGETAAGHRGDAGVASERRVETLAVAVGRDELRAGEIVPDADVQRELFEERQQQSAGNEVGQERIGKYRFFTFRERARTRNVYGIYNEFRPVVSRSYCNCPTRNWSSLGAVGRGPG